MLIGIDMGTTRTIAAGVDRGSYPGLRFTDPDGDEHDHFPSVIAEVDGELVHGFEAERAARAGAAHLRSFKRLLGDPGTHPGTTVRLGGREHLLLDLVTASGFSREYGLARRGVTAAGDAERCSAESR